MQPQISFSGDINWFTQQMCERRLWQTYTEVPPGSKILCHISDREVEYSGTLFVYLAEGSQLVAHSIADDPLDVLDEMVMNIENQVKFRAHSVSELKERRPEVLIVDDDPDSILMMQLVLSKLNRPSLFVMSPQKAVDLMTRNHYKLAVMDMMMPGVDGLQVIANTDARLRSLSGPPVFEPRPFVIYSSQASDDLSSTEFDHFKCVGRWKKQQGYGELALRVARTLIDLEAVR